MGKFNFKKIKKLYFIGIKGAGMAALAEILKKRGFSVSGSDTTEKFYTESVLKRAGIRFISPFAPENIPKDAGLVIYSTAYNEQNNPEISEAQKRGMLLISYPEMLGMLFRESLGIAVAGTHGKTTTTALLAEVLAEGGLDPSAIVGSRVTQWKGSARAGKGRYFVIEADEYQNKLRFYDPLAVILTSVDWDHPDFFPSFAAYKDAFREFIGRIPRHGFLVVWGDSSSTLEVAEAARCEVIRYGFGEENDLRVRKLKSQHFEISYQGASLGEFRTALVGDHNILNTAAVIAVAAKLKLKPEAIRKAVESFRGTERRFELVGEKNGAVLIDDYAHHPEEIKATLRGARERYPEKKIIAVFHPHTFTRTKALLEDFAQSFDDADQVLVLDIYGSAREVRGGVSSEELVEHINRYDREKAEYLPTVNEAVGYLEKEIGKQELVISMGAGNVWEVTHRLKKGE